MKRWDVYLVRLDPVEGSEQAGTRPCLIVTRDAINRYSPVVMITPFTDAVNVSRIYPNDVLVHSKEGGLSVDSVALTGQTRAIAKTRLITKLWQKTTSLFLNYHLSLISPGYTFRSSLSLPSILSI